MYVSSVFSIKASNVHGFGTQMESCSSLVDMLVQVRCQFFRKFPLVFLPIWGGSEEGMLGTQGSSLLSEEEEELEQEEGQRQRFFCFFLILTG